MQSSAYKSEMRECLRKVAKRAAGRADLLGIKSKVVRIAQHLFKNESGFFKAFRACQCIHKPECTHAECAFMPSQSVPGCKLSIQFVARDQTVGDKFFHGEIDCAEHARILGRNKFENGHHQVACVQRFRLEGLGEALLLRVPTFFHDQSEDAVSFPLQLGAIKWKAALGCQPYSTIQSHPALQFGVHELLSFAANLP